MRDLVLRITYENVVTDLDIDSNIPLRLDISAFDNSRIGVLFGVGSQTFDLPGTKKNNVFFKNAYEIGATDTPALYNFIPASILLDGDEVLAGSMQLLETITSEDGYVVYKVILVDQLIQFTSNLEGAFISNADFSALNHNLSIEFITGSWSSSANITDLPLNGAVYYPMIDYGNDGNINYFSGDLSSGSLPYIQFSGREDATGSIDNQSTPMTYQQFLPAIRSKELLDIICAQVGFSYTSSFANLTSSAFKDTYVLAKSTDTLGATSAGASNEQFSGSLASNQAVPAPAGVWVPYEVTTKHQQFFDPSSNYSNINFQYTVPIDGAYNVDFSTAFTATIGGSSARYLTGVRVDKAAGGTDRYVIGPSMYTSTQLVTQSGAFTIPNLNSGDTLEMILQYQPLGGGSIPLSTTIYQNASQTYFYVTSTPVSYANSPIDMAQQFDGNTKTLDLFKGFLEQFNMVAFPEQNENNVIQIEPFDTWMLQGREINWTDKFEAAKRISITTPIAEQAKETFIGASNDNDRFSKITIDNQPNLQFGTVQLVSDSTIPQGTRKITTFFAPIIMGTMLASGSINIDGTPTYNLGISDDYITHLYKYDNSGLKSFNFKPRIGYKLTGLPLSNAANSTMYIGDPGIGSIPYNGIEGYATLANISAIGNLTNIFNLHFDNTYNQFVSNGSEYDIGVNVAQTAYESYWKNYITGLYWNESKKVTMDLYFTPEEYKDIKLNDKITIKDQQYRINKIKGFNLQEPDVVAVELLKLYPVFNNVPASGLPIPGPPYPPPPPPDPSPTPTPTPTPTPIGCREYTIYGNTSGDFEEATFICCDGSAGYERVEDYASTTFCAQEGSVINSGTGGILIGGVCTTPC